MAVIKYKDFTIKEKPYYEPVGKEIQLFEAAYDSKRPVALVGPTGCGKTQLASFMAYSIASRNKEKKFPYIEIPCNEDVTERHLLGGMGVDGKWHPGPLYTLAKTGGMLVLDEIVEARKDVTVLLHPLTDDRRYLPVTRKGEVLTPPDDFMVVVCYNPGYQVRNKNLKPSTRQRFVTIEMDYPNAELETKIVVNKTNVDYEVADKFVRFANLIREARTTDMVQLQEGASTRLLIMASELYLKNQEKNMGLSLEDIARGTILNPITSEETDREVMSDFLSQL